MEKLIFVLMAIYCVTLVSAENKAGNPVTQSWNVTDERGDYTCIKLDAGIRLDVVYFTMDHNKKTATFVTDGNVTVNEHESQCVGKNSTDQKLVLKFQSNENLTLFFSRRHNITGDEKEEKWELYRIEFDVDYDEVDFPHIEQSLKDHHGRLTNAAPQSFASAPRGNAYGCTKPDPMKVLDNFTVTFDHFQVQPFLTESHYDKVQWCPNEQTSDLIPIIIGAALAALVVIVLIVYLVGRARARTTTYDNI